MEPEEGLIPRTTTPGRAHSVLVVDDNETTRFLMERMLDIDYGTHAAGTVEEAIAAASNLQYDAVLMDINLGAKASGEDVMQRIRQLDGYVDIPIVAFTAYALPGDRERFLNSGFDGYLSKPFTKQQLLSLLNELIDGKLVSDQIDSADRGMQMIISGRGARSTDRPAIDEHDAGEPSASPESIA